MTDQTRRPTTPEVWSAGPRWAHLVVLGTVLLTYGFELFNFNVSADEPLYWNLSRADMMEVWNGQGRWGMAITSWLLPSTNVPVVPLALGLAAATAALWWLGRSIMGLSEWEAAFATSLAVSLPALVFHFSYSINSLGLGLAYLACAASAVWVTRRGVLAVAGAVFAGAYAIGVYEGFAFVLVTVFLALIWREATWAMVGRTAATAIAAAGVWFALSKLVTLGVSEGRSGYVGDILGLGGISADPAGRAIDAITRMVGIVIERWLYFGYSNPLPAIVMAAVFAGAVRAAWTRPRSERLIAVLVLVGLALIPLVAAFLTKVLFQRSMVFLPTIFVILCGIGLPVLRHLGGRTIRQAAVVLAVLAVAGQATLANGAFYSGTVVADDDMVVTSQIAATYRSLPTAFEGPLAVVIAPRSEEFSRPDNWSARSSFEAGVMGSAGDALKFLQMRGINVVLPTPEQVTRGAGILATMPAYPEPGYLQVQDGVLLINLSTVPGR